MNIDELEKLARAAKENMSISSSSFQWEYRRAANPAAILELIENYRDLVQAIHYAIHQHHELLDAPGVCDVFVKIKNGEINE